MQLSEPSWSSPSSAAPGGPAHFTPAPCHVENAAVVARLTAFASLASAERRLLLTQTGLELSLLLRA